MEIPIAYDRKQVLQALRYHFITRPEIKIMLIVVNVFTIVSAVLLYMHRIHPLPFLIFSVLWFGMIVTIWRILPAGIYKRSETFRDKFMLAFRDRDILLSTDRGAQSWGWERFSSFLESPYFFHLYFNSRAFFLVPKDAFSSITDVQTVRAMLREKIGKK